MSADRVRVGVGIFFGENVIRSWEATPKQAAAYEAFVRRELWGLTVRPLPAGAACEPLPEPDWWLLVSR
jgi:hypothetical protein